MSVTQHQGLGSIRWRLTGSFVLVTLLLALSLLWVLSTVALLQLRSNANLAMVADQARLIAAKVHPGMSEAEFRQVAISADKRIPVWIQPTVPSEPPLVYYIVTLLDQNGRIEASTAPEEHPLGAFLDQIEPAPISNMLAAVQHDGSGTAAESAWIEPQHQPMALVPVTVNQVRKMVFARIVGFPAPDQLMNSLQPLLRASVVVWLVLSLILGLGYGWLASHSISTRLQRVMAASQALAAGESAPRVEDSSPDEIGQLARQFNVMSERLSTQIHDLRALAEQNAELARRNAELAILEERSRVARELHDSVSQELFSLSMLASATRRLLTRKPEVIDSQLAQLEALSRQALQDTRGLIFALRPAELDGRGLGPALHDLAGAARDRQGLDVELTISGTQPLPLEHEEVLFRIAQEALANVARHSGVRAVELELDVGPEQVELNVIDHGRGFDTSTPHSSRSFGLRSMSERAAALGGSCEVSSQAGQGTVVRVVLPIKRQEQPQNARGGATHVD